LKQANSIVDIPNWSLLQILSLLDEPQLLRCRLVSHKWNTFCLAKSVSTTLCAKVENRTRIQNGFLALNFSQYIRESIDNVCFLAPQPQHDTTQTPFLTIASQVNTLLLQDYERLKDFQPSEDLASGFCGENAEAKTQQRLFWRGLDMPEGGKIASITLWDNTSICVSVKEQDKLYLVKIDEEEVYMEEQEGSFTLPPSPSHQRFATDLRESLLEEDNNNTNNLGGHTVRLVGVLRSPLPSALVMVKGFLFGLFTLPEDNSIKRWMGDSLTLEEEFFSHRQLPQVNSQPSSRIEGIHPWPEKDCIVLSCDRCCVCFVDIHTAKVTRTVDTTSTGEVLSTFLRRGLSFFSKVEEPPPPRFTTRVCRGFSQSTIITFRRPKRATLTTSSPPAKQQQPQQQPTPPVFQVWNREGRLLQTWKGDAFASARKVSLTMWRQLLVVCYCEGSLYHLAIINERGETLLDGASFSIDTGMKPMTEEENEEEAGENDDKNTKEARIGRLSRPVPCPDGRLLLTCPDAHFFVYVEVEPLPEGQEKGNNTYHLSFA